MSTQTITIQLNSTAQTAGITTTLLGLGRVQSAVTGLGAGLGQFVDRYMGRLAAAVSFGALARFGKQAIDAADDLAKNAQAAGVAADQFSALSYAGDLARVSQEQLIQGSKFLGQWMQKTGQDATDFTQALLNQADAFAGMADGPEKVRLAVERFGRAGQQMIPLLNQGSEAIREQMREAEQFGAIVGPRFAANAQQFNDNLTRVGTMFRGVFNLLADALLPTFIEFQESFIKWVKDTGANIGAVDTLIQTFKGFALVLLEVQSALAAVSQGWAAVGTFFGTLSVTGSVDEAAKAANKKLTFLEDYSRRLDKILNIGRSADKGSADKRDTAPALATTMEDYETKLSEIATRIAIVNDSFTLSEQERNASLIQLHRQRIEFLKGMMDELDRTVQTKMGDGGVATKEYAEQASKFQTILKGIEESMNTIDKITSESGFIARFTTGLRRMNDEWSKIGSRAADVALKGISSSIDTIADGIWGLIDGTATWGELFVQVARQIISDLIRIAIQALVVRVLLSGLGFSGGGAVPGKSYASGGFTGAMATDAVAGVVHGGEFVFSAPAVQTAGVDTLSRLHHAFKGVGSGASGLETSMTSGLGASGESGQQPQMNILIVDSRNSQAARDFIMSNAGKVQIVEAVRERRMDVGVPA